MNRRAILLVANPARAIIHGLHMQGLHERHGKIVVGVAFCIAGSTMATHPVEFIPHFLWDAVAYGLHGFGLEPIFHGLRRHKRHAAIMELRKAAPVPPTTTRRHHHVNSPIWGDE